MLKHISSNDIHKITSGQVIIDLKSCLKEIIENAIDANATRLEIVVKNYGVTSLEISDNGDGINTEDYDKICLNHYTSKISSFDEVNDVTTFGFRGELMSSLCSISDLSIVTTQNEPVAMKLKYDHLGRLIDKARISRNKGTTVIVENLFKNLPVRQKNFIKNCRKEYLKMINLIQQYCIITNLRIIVHHITDKKKIVLSSNGQSMIANIEQMFSGKFTSSLEELKFTIDKFNIVVSGYVSNCSFGQGRNSGDRQMLFINQRPVIMPKLNKLINEVYKNFNHLEIPSFFLNLNIDSKFIDINITPDKMTILISREFEIFEMLKDEFMNFFDNQGHIIPKNSTSEFENKRQGDLSDFIKSEPSQIVEESVTDQVDDEKENSFALIRESIKRKAAVSSSSSSFEESQTSLKRRVFTRSNESDDNMSSEEDESIEQPVEEMEKEEEEDKMEEEEDKEDKIEEEEDNIEEEDKVEEEEKQVKFKSNSRENLQQHDIYLEIDPNDLILKKNEQKTTKALDELEVSDLSNQAQISINKSQFQEMQVIGQFNLGFIIVVLEIQEKLNLFIIDQHASDEKYNFETLMSQTVLRSQKLISPLDMHLNPIDELVVLDNLQIFIKNGFQLDDDSKKIVSIPMSKNVIFNIHDFEELIHLIRSNPHNPNIRPSKIYKMFASRACRSSTMIGDHLNFKKMQKIVKNLSLIDKPWNCPHGRPTMRHLIELNDACFIKDYI